LGFLKIPIRETKMNGLDKTSLIGTFVLFLKFFVSIAYDF